MSDEEWRRQARKEAASAMPDHATPAFHGVTQPQCVIPLRSAACGASEHAQPPLHSQARGHQAAEGAPSRAWWDDQ